MRLLQLCALLSTLCALAACGTGSDDSSDLLIENYSPPGGGLVWTCPDGTAFTLDSDLSKQSTICLGIDGSECPDSDTPGPGDAQCDDPSFNAFKNTCVEAFFSCFQPSGTCEVQGNGDQLWGNGALQNRNYPGFLSGYFASGEQEPCVTGTLRDGYVSYRRAISPVGG